LRIRPQPSKSNLIQQARIACTRQRTRQTPLACLAFGRLPHRLRLAVIQWGSLAPWHQPDFNGPVTERLKELPLRHRVEGPQCLGKVMTIANS
jgi:hypothetical protein